MKLCNVKVFQSVIYNHGVKNVGNLLAREMLFDKGHNGLQ